VIGAAGHALTVGGPDRARLSAGCQATDLSVAQAVVAEHEDLARDGDLGDLLAAALGDPLVAVAQRAAAGAGVLGGLDERPAQRASPGCGADLGAPTTRTRARRSTMAPWSSQMTKPGRLGPACCQVEPNREARPRS
jgi:hypothetical protein